MQRTTFSPLHNFTRIALNHIYARTVVIFAIVKYRTLAAFCPLNFFNVMRPLPLVANITEREQGNMEQQNMCPALAIAGYSGLQRTWPELKLRSQLTYTPRRLETQRKLKPVSAALWAALSTGYDSQCPVQLAVKGSGCNENMFAKLLWKYDSGDP